LSPSLYIEGGDGFLFFIRNWVYFSEEEKSILRSMKRILCHLSALSLLFGLFITSLSAQNGENGAGTAAHPEGYPGYPGGPSYRNGGRGGDAWGGSNSNGGKEGHVLILKTNESRSGEKWESIYMAMHVLFVIQGRMITFRWRLL